MSASCLWSFVYSTDPILPSPLPPSSTCWCANGLSCGTSIKKKRNEQDKTFHFKQGQPVLWKL